jgi:phosphoribosylformylglycinamidine (FGAM) synthase PurS component
MSAGGKSNQNSYAVEVRLKHDYPDAEGANALSLLSSVGLSAAKDVRVARVYQMRGALNLAHAQQAARELLCDPVTQEFKMITPAGAVLNGMTHWRVEVWLKTSVSDPVGDSVREAMADLGLPSPESVRMGLVYQIAGKCGRNQLEKAVGRVLANPVIHQFSVSEAHP